MARRTLAAMAAGLVALVAGADGVAAPTCPEIPAISWWGDVGHAATRAYVDERHDGDWEAYLLKWERQLARLEKVRAHDPRADEAKGLRLGGEALASYVDKVRRRVEVIRCLADEQRARAALGKTPGPT